MLEISELKAKKLPELQELANTLKVPKYRTLKKLDLVYQILDYQAANPNAVKAIVKEDYQRTTPSPVQLLKHLNDHLTKLETNKAPRAKANS